MSNGKLSLTRKPNQPLYLQFIDQDGNLREINLTVTSISGQQAKLVIDAPETVSITRGEILNR